MAGSPQKRRKREARLLAERYAVPENVDPMDTMQHCLERAFAMLLYTESQVDKRETFVKGTDKTNRWYRLEQDLRREVAALSGQMIGLGIAERRAKATELIAATLAPVLDNMLKELNLTKAQREKAPEVVRASLRLLEGGRG